MWEDEDGRRHEGRDPRPIWERHTQLPALRAWWKTNGGTRMVRETSGLASEWVQERGGTAAQGKRVEALMMTTSGEPVMPELEPEEIREVRTDDMARDGHDLVLKPEQERFLANVASGMTMPAAAKAAGYRRSDAHRYLVPICRKRFRRLLANRISLTKLVDTLADGLEAEKVSLAQADGKFTDERKAPDFAERRKYVESVAKLLGLEEDRRDKTAGNQTTVVLAGWMAPARKE